MKRLWMAGLLFFCLLWADGKIAMASEDEKVAVEAERTAGQAVPMEETEDTGEEIREGLLADMDFTQVQDMLDEMLGGESFSFSKALKDVMSGEDAFTKEAMQELVRGLFFSRFEEERGIFVKILMLVFLAAVFSNLAAVFDNGQIGEVSFYVVYLLLFTLLTESFSVLSMSLSESLSWMTEFMRALAPAYFAAMAAAQGASSAAAFYQGILLLIWMIQWLLLRVILPGANLYILMRLINHLSREEMLSKMAELLGTAIGWSLKTILGVMVGMQVVRSLVAPVMDSLKRGVIGRTASFIPGVGGAVNSVTELIVTSAVLVRNSLGVVILAVIILVGAGPVIRYVFLSLAYRFLGALAQPISDKRMVGALGTMGEGAAMLLRILLTADVMCMLAFVILMAGFGGGG